jgi:hypothetical protein
LVMLDRIYALMSLRTAPIASAMPAIN